MSTATAVGSTLRRMGRVREAGIITILVLLVIAITLIDPRVMSPPNLRILLLAIPLIVVMAMGQMLVIVARHVDLSIGSIVGLSGISVGMMLIENPDLPVAVTFLLGAGIGAALGLFNGVIVTVFGLPAIIVTLGTLSLFRGLVFIVSGGRQVDPNHIPVELIRFSQTSPIGIPGVVLLAGVIVVATHLFTTYTRSGREIYAIGSNPSAAVLRGIDARLLTLTVFVLSGTAAGIAGIMYASRFGYVNPAITGLGVELTVIAAVVIGGTSITGGTGSVIGTFLGCLLLGLISTSLPILGVPGSWQFGIYGAIIVVALVIDRVVLSSSRSTTRRTEAA